MNKKKKCVKSVVVNPPSDIGHLQSRAQLIEQQQAFISDLQSILKCTEKEEDSNEHHPAPRIDTFKKAFTKVEDNRWLCNQCGKIISKCSKRNHYDKACRLGLDTLQCSYCFVFLGSYNQKSRHQKICTRNPINHPTQTTRT